MKVSATPNLDMRCTGRQTISFDFFHEQHFINGLLEGSALASLPEPAVYAERLVEAMRARGLAKGDDLHLLDPEQARFVGIVHVTVEGPTHATSSS